MGAPPALATGRRRRNASKAFQVWWPPHSILRRLIAGSRCSASGAGRRSAGSLHRRLGGPLPPLRQPRAGMRLGDGALTQPAVRVPSVSNVTQRSLSEIDSRIVQLERQLAGSDADSSGSEAEIDSAALQRASARKDGKAVAAAPAAKRPREGTAPPAPAEEVAGASLHCELCGVSVTSQALMREHLRGRKHRDAARFKEAACEGRFCATCGLAFTSAAQLKEHCNGKTHRSRLAAGAGKGGKGGGAGKGGGGGKGGGEDGGEGSGKGGGASTGSVW